MEPIFDALPIPLPVFALLFATVALGSLVQGTIGFGLNVIAAPIAAIVQPDALPAAMIIMSLPMTAGAALRERDHIDRRGVAWTTLGRLPGVALGSFIVATLDASELATWIGGMVVVAASMSVMASSIPVTALPLALAGAVAGFMGTTSSMGGPPIALLYQREPGPTLRSTLGATFLIGSALSLAALAVTGHVAPWHWGLGAALTPAVGLGLVVSRRLHARVDAGWLRPAVVGFACLAGLAVMLRDLV
ncbi:MAG: sulfite exporter TauE/SafE family protein [Deltaproteobacteria bacterium]|nr:sulfite exporter TauE/SafE family protein [Deltaproteobacteria bacterium]